MEWQAWTFIGICVAFVPFFYLVASGKLTKARKVEPKK
jgi:hypothetical protein